MKNTAELQQLIDTIKDLEVKMFMKQIMIYNSQFPFQYLPTDFVGFETKIGIDVAALAKRVDDIKLVYDTRFGSLDTSVAGLNVRTKFQINILVSLNYFDFSG